MFPVLPALPLLLLAPWEWATLIGMYFRTLLTVFGLAVSRLMSQVFTALTCFSLDDICFILFGLLFSLVASDPTAFLLTSLLPGFLCMVLFKASSTWTRDIPHALDCITSWVDDPLGHRRQAAKEFAAHLHLIKQSIREAALDRQRLEAWIRVFRQNHGALQEDHSVLQGYHVALEKNYAALQEQCITLQDHRNAVQEQFRDQKGTMRFLALESHFESAFLREQQFSALSEAAQLRAEVDDLRHRLVDQEGRLEFTRAGLQFASEVLARQRRRFLADLSEERRRNTAALDAYRAGQRVGDALEEDLVENIQDQTLENSMLRELLEDSRLDRLRLEQEYRQLLGSLDQHLDWSPDTPELVYSPSPRFPSESPSLPPLDFSQAYVDSSVPCASRSPAL